MKTDSFIWIQVLPKEKISYSCPLAAWAKSNFPDLTIFDFDNYSEVFVVDQAGPLMIESDRLAVLIQAEEGALTGQVTRFLNRLSREPKGIPLIILEGRHAVIEKMIRVIAEGKFLDNPGTEEQKTAIRECFDEQ